MKKRLDVLLVERGFCESRSKAAALIMEGKVYVNGGREDKAGTAFDEKVLIEIHGKRLRYVSRGGLKLEKALNVFDVDLEGKTCMDVGSSTGGFTDCMLQNGAARVYAVDVGTGQLDWKLRTDPRVICMEKTNIRYLLPENIDERPEFVSIDVAFISLTKVLLPVRNLMAKDASAVALIKPQFEAGREKVGKKGVVRDRAVHVEVIETVLGFADAVGFSVTGLDYSPVKGPEGNIEYLAYLKLTGHIPEEGVSGDASASPGNHHFNNQSNGYTVRALVDKAHEELD